MPLGRALKWKEICFSSYSISMQYHLSTSEWTSHSSYLFRWYYDVCVFFVCVHILNLSAHKPIYQTAFRIFQITVLGALERGAVSQKGIADIEQVRWIYMSKVSSLRYVFHWEFWTHHPSCVFKWNSSRKNGMKSASRRVQDDWSVVCLKIDCCFEKMTSNTTLLYKEFLYWNLFKHISKESKYRIQSHLGKPSVHIKYENVRS